MEKAKKPPLYTRIFRHKAFLPVTLFAVIIIVFTFSSRFSERPPVIDSISPEIGNPGDILIITGDYFGETRDGGEVRIAGSRPTTSSYKEWSDTRISVQIPQDAGSGMLYVVTKNGRSKGHLFTNRQHIPVVMEGPARPGLPYVDEITPTNGTVGTLITITGMNFGIERGSSKVYFTPVPITDGVRQAEESRDLLLSPEECDYDYEHWADTEIRVYIPDGASSGNVSVFTDKGQSNFLYFEVSEQAGTKILKQKRGYQIQYGVQLFNVRASEGNLISLWVPRLSGGLEQTNIEMIQDPEPYWDTYPGLFVYRFENVPDAARLSVSQTYWFDRYAVETKIKSTKVENQYNTDRTLYKVYTSNDVFVPSDDAEIQNIANSVIKNEKNPYLKALSLFQYVLRRYSYTNQPVVTDPVESIETREGDAYIYAMVYCALLRSGGVPSRPVAGYIVYGNKQKVRHYWVEFYLENFGWVPVDPALADGAVFGDFPEAEDPENYYFGNIDNQHIMFSQGILQTKQLSHNANVIRKKRMYSLQTIHEESSKNIASYSSVWQDISVIDWW